MSSEISHLRTAKDQAEIFFARLKEETLEMHQRLEKHRLSLALMSTSVSLQDYILYLQKIEPVMQFCEIKIFPVLHHILPDLPQRKKAHLITEDLNELGAEKSPLSYDPFDTVSVPFALGYLYVIEGSTLGGRIILKHVQSKLNIDAEHGGLFFAGYKDATSIKWKELLKSVWKYVSCNDCEEELIAGARNAFSSIHDHFGTDYADKRYH